MAKGKKNAKSGPWHEVNSRNWSGKLSQKKFQLQIKAKAGANSVEFEAVAGSPFDEFETDQDRLEFLQEVWTDISLSFEYGGEEADKDLRDSQPFGEFDEGELVDGDNSGYWTVLEFDHDSECVEFFEVIDITLDIEASSIGAAKSFAVENVPRCFMIYSHGSQQSFDIDIIEVTSAREVSGPKSTSPIRFCTSCGTPRPEGAKFCASCGERF